MLNKRIIGNILAEMGRHGISQRQLAASTGKSVTTVSSYLTLKKFPTLNWIEKCANHMCIDPLELLS